MSAEPVHDVAHIAHAELLTPFPEESLRFFVELFGMQIQHREGQSVFLRGWGEYQPYGLKLTESELPGLGHTALRAWSPSALDRRVAAIEAAGFGIGWNEGDHGHGPAFEFRDPDGHRFELFFEQDRYVPPEELRPRLKNVPQRHVDRGAAVKRIDHVNVLASDVAANRRFAVEQLGYRTYEQVINDDGSEQGAWMSLSIAAHELIYTSDHAGGNGRLHHLAWFVDTREELLRAADLFLDADVPIEAAPSKHAVAQGMFLYVYEPGGNRVEVTTGTHFIYDPAYEPIVWTQAERARGQAWGVKTIETFHTYGTPDLSGRPPGPPIPPTSQIPTLSQRRSRMSDDRALIRELVENWVVWRDAGDWERFATVWHPEGFMMATWFQGPAADFIRVSREGFERGVNILHFLGGHSVDLAGNRAISQTKMTILQRADVHGVSCDIACIGRFYDFLEKREGRWGIVLRQPIYEKDRLDPVDPAVTLELDADLLARFPAGYRHLAYAQTQIGYDVKRDMPGLVGPGVERLYRRGSEWLAGGEIGEFGAGIASDPAPGDPLTTLD